MMTEQVVPQGGKPSSTSRLSRWQLAVVGAVVALAAGIGLVLGFSVLSPRANPLGGAATYVPANAVMYFEARLDQSPSQAAAMKAFLGHFPAVDADKPLLETIGAAIDTALPKGGTSITFSGDVEPWFDGRVAVGLLDYPLAPITSDSAALPKTALLFGVQDAAAANAFADKLRGEMGTNGSALTSSQHAGVTIWSLDDGSATAAGGLAFAVADDELLVSNASATIETMLDTHAGSSSFADRPELQQLAGHVASDWSGYFAVDGKQIFDQMKSAMASAQPAVGAMLDSYLGRMATFSVGTLSFESDALVMDAAGAAPSGDDPMTNSSRDLAAHAPADALVFADAGTVGPSLASLLGAIRDGAVAQDDTGQAKQALEQAEAALGAKLPELVSWIGDAAVVGGVSDGTPYGGLVLQATDVDAATQRLNQLRSLLELAAQSSNGPVKVTTSSVGGTEMTTITLDLGQGGGDLMPLPAGKVIVEYAIKDGTVLIGFGDRFVGRSLSLSDGDSLADAARFSGAVDRFGGADNAGVVFVDLAGLRQAVEAMTGPMLPDSYSAQIQPNLKPFDYLVSVTQVDGGTVETHTGIVIH